MIYFLADQHGGERLGDLKKYIETATKNDILIILGDVGVKFRSTDENKQFDELLLSSKNKLAIVDGNHENFNYLYSFPEEEWNGGVVHRITENIVHLKRGYVFEIDGKTFFVFGGCKSTDKWKDMGLWYPEEEPTNEELTRAYSNLKKYNNKVDYILTHKYEMTQTGTKELFELCNYINEKVEFKHFYSGHSHVYAPLDEKHTIVYDKLVSLE